jgi:hypothetical protein
VTKKIFTPELEWTSRRGRPRKGWKEEVERDLQVLGVRRSRELVTDREKWKDIVRQAKADSGLRGPMEEEEDILGNRWRESVQLRPPPPITYGVRANDH